MLYTKEYGRRRSGTHIPRFHQNLLPEQHFAKDGIKAKRNALFERKHLSRNALERSVSRNFLMHFSHLEFEHDSHVSHTKAV